MHLLQDMFTLAHGNMNSSQSHLNSGNCSACCFEMVLSPVSWSFIAWMYISVFIQRFKDILFRYPELFLNFCPEHSSYLCLPELQEAGLCLGSPSLGCSLGTGWRNCRPPYTLFDSYLSGTQSCTLVIWCLDSFVSYILHDLAVV